MNAKKTKSVCKKKLNILFVSILLLIILVLVYLGKIVNPIIVTYSEGKVRSLASAALNAAIDEIIDGNELYSDLIQIERNSDGDIVAVLAKTGNVNKFNKNLSTLSQNNIDEIGKQGLNIPIGNLTGIGVFAGKGFNVKINFISVGNTSLKFVTSFKSAGINQTSHKVYIDMTAIIDVIMPMKTKQVVTSAQVLIAECLIVGKVPDTYLNSNSLDEMLNLVPQ